MSAWVISAGRRAVLAGLLALPVAAFAAEPPPRILFVCQFGSVRSPIARELLKRRAAERGISVAVQSRGITPEPHLSPELAATVEADKLDLASQPLRGLGQGDVDAADVVIHFDPLSAGLRVKNARDWSDIGSMNANYPAARANLMRRIDALIDELALRQY
jgi:protein-tyrosine-phosphatase